MSNTQNKNIFSSFPVENTEYDYSDDDDNITIIMNKPTPPTTPAFTPFAVASVKKQNCFSKKTSTSFTIGTSRISELKDERRHCFTPTERTAAFETMANTEKISEKLAYTKMCNSIGSGRPCPHGEKCRFAHNIDQLVVRECFFGERCRFIINRDNTFFNKTKTKQCDHKHPGETTQNYQTRTGISKLNSLDVIDRERELANITEVIVPVQVIKQVNRQMFGQDSVPDTVLNSWKQREEQTTIISKEEAKEEEETVLRVPMEMAIQAMEMAMKNGKTNIRVEIV